MVLPSFVSPACLLPAPPGGEPATPFQNGPNYEL
jgi:hypothetical protein